MIQCPKCREYRVLEELHVPMPIKKSRGILEPNVSRLLVIVVTLGVVALVLAVGRLLPEGRQRDLGTGFLICIAAAILTTLPFFLVRIAFLGDRFKPQDRWPRVYRRTCKACDYHWLWKPGEPQSGLQIQPDLSRERAPTPVESVPEHQRPEDVTEKRGAQPFLCPDCGHTSHFDPWTQSAHCPHCGFRPPTGRQKLSYLRAMERSTHQPLLDELLSHWNGTHTPDPDFELETIEHALLFFKDYQRALGEHLVVTAGERMLYLRDYHPKREEILAFTGAYLHLRRGHRDKAEAHLQELVQACPRFVDAWVWLTATTDDLATRQAHLEKAVSMDASHPLARDALAIARGQVSLAGRGRMRELDLEATVTQCAQCGGSLHYEAGASEVECPYCGYLVPLREITPVDAEATPISHLRLERRYQGHAWGQVERIMSCQTCGAQLTMTHHLAQNCAFCGSTTVLAEDNWRTFEQPDGLVPFQVDERQAADAIHTAWKRRKGGRWSHKLSELRGVYVPFWVFDGVVEIRWWVQSNLQSTLSQLSQESDFRQYQDLLFPAVDIPPPSFLEPIESFDLSAMTPYAPHLLADWPAQLYSLDVEGVAEEAGNAMMALARLQAGPPVIWRTVALPVGQRSKSRPPSAMRSFQVHSITYQLVLLPMWVAPLRDRERHRLVLVNGQSGQAALSP